MNGRCLIGGSGRHSNAFIGQFERMSIQTYGGSSCEGGTQTAANTRQVDEMDTRYRWVLVL